VNILKLLEKFVILFALGMFFGCISFLEETAPIQPNVSKTCRTVIVQEPYMAKDCQNVSKMEEVCQIRELNYTQTDVTKIWLCTEKDLCVDYFANGSCAVNYCSKGMTRCNLNITNTDPQKSGEWVVNANFTIDGSTFGKNPIKKTLFPGDSANFNFEQFYLMDLNQKKAECEIFVSVPARIQDCSFITKIIEQCQNTTQFKDVEKQVCE
jgi:hypothetical protein